MNIPEVFVVIILPHKQSFQRYIAITLSVCMSVHISSKRYSFLTNEPILKKLKSV